jgi:hypothetical protein
MTGTDNDCMSTAADIEARWKELGIRIRGNRDMARRLGDLALQASVQPYLTRLRRPQLPHGADDVGWLDGTWPPPSPRCLNRYALRSSMPDHRRPLMQPRMPVAKFVRSSACFQHSSSSPTTPIQSHNRAFESQGAGSEGYNGARASERRIWAGVSYRETEGSYSLYGCIEVPTVPLRSCNGGGHAGSR